MNRRSWHQRSFLIAACVLGIAAIAIGAGLSRPVHGQNPFFPTPSPTPVLGIPPATPAPSVVPTVPPGTNVTYPIGWNLVAGTGAVIGGASNLYTLQPADTSYEVLNGSTPLVAGNGYWVNLSGITPVQITGTNAETYSRQLPAGKYVLIGNPFPTIAVVSGADVMYVYDPVTGYDTATVLQPGQGAWAFSYTGGTLTFTVLEP